MDTSEADQRVDATLTESAPVRDLLAQLQATIDTVDYGQVEKTGPFRHRSPWRGNPTERAPT